MSLEILLSYGDKIAQVEPHFDGITSVDHRRIGGLTYVGSDDASLNVTSNYSELFSALDMDKGIHWLYGKRAQETIERLEFAVDLLGTERDADSWKPTMGNAGYALSRLLDWARRHPDAKWKIMS